MPAAGAEHTAGVTIAQMIPMTRSRSGSDHGGRCRCWVFIDQGDGYVQVTAPDGLDPATIGMGEL